MKLCTCVRLIKSDNISYQKLEFLALIVFEISSFLHPNLQRAITLNMILGLVSPDNLVLIIVFQLIKFEAPSCDNFFYIF